MRMGRHEPDDALAARMGELLAAAPFAPRRVYRRFDLSEFPSGHPLDCLPRLNILQGCANVYLLCATLGSEFDAWQRRLAVSSGADALITQAIGAAVIERWIDATEDEIRGELAAGEGLRIRYSPGFGDFPLSAQPAILTILDAPRRIGVSFTDSLLMVPSKSVTAVIGVCNGETAK